MEKKIKFAVVGCGHIGKRHAEMIKRAPDAELVGLIDIKRKEELNLNGFDVPVYHSVSAFLNSGQDVDVINIATPNGFHANQALECLEARKHVVIEKPLALTKKDAEKVIFKALHVHKHVSRLCKTAFLLLLCGLKTL
jgi:UDP-N-acetyl-2-amino-2-deoxyglucuronate dehydrogenase